MTGAIRIGDPIVCPACARSYVERCDCGDPSPIVWMDEPPPIRLRAPTRPSLLARLAGRLRRGRSWSGLVG